MSEDSDFIIQFTQSFKAIRVIDTRLIPTTWDLRVELIFDEDLAGTAEYDLAVHAALSKIKYWFRTVLESSVIIDRDSAYAHKAFLDDEGRIITGNNLVTLPGHPGDDLLVSAIHSKINALAHDVFWAGTIDITNDDNGLHYVFFGEGDERLPTMDEWVGERTYFPVPWWGRNDASVMDVIPGEDADLSIPPAFAYSLDFVEDEILGLNKREPAPVIRPNFKPTIIDGGKK